MQLLVKLLACQPLAPSDFVSKSFWTAALAGATPAVLHSNFATVSAILQCAVLALQVALLLKAIPCGHNRTCDPAHTTSH